MQSASVTKKSCIPERVHLAGRMVGEQRATLNLWRSMHARCRSNHPRYGGRGIVVCERWASFAMFLQDMGPRPNAWNGQRAAFWLERIDNDGNYEPTNCRWATVSEQARNRSSNLVIAFRGQSKILADWVDELALDRRLVEMRLYRGWSAERAFTVPARHRSAARAA